MNKNFWMRTNVYGSPIEWCAGKDGVGREIRLYSRKKDAQENNMGGKEHVRKVRISMVKS